MSKYRLTTAFVLISVLTLGTAAFALNFLAARTAEANLVELTTERSMRDASIIAGVVNQLLADQDVDSTDGPARLAHTVTIESQKLLDSLRVIDISLYDTTGRNLWSTSGDLISERTVPRSVFESASNGGISSSLGTIEIRGSEVPDFEIRESGNYVAGIGGSDDSSRKTDVVEIYLPLLAASGDRVVGVIGITRDVTGTLTAQIAKTRSSVMIITLSSLGGVFLILLIFEIINHSSYLQTRIHL